MTSPKKKNQHYVPQYYFKNFNEGKKFISSLLISKRKIIQNCSIADQASKSYFYGDSDFEDKVCKVENQLRANLQQVINTNAINNGNRAGLIEHLLYQEARTSKKREQTQEAWKHIEAMLDALDKNNITQTREALSREKIDSIKPDEKFWHWRQMNLSIDSSWQLKDLDYILLNNHTKIPFVFSDAPVVLLNPHMDNFREKGVTGVLSKGLIAIFPLSNNHCALFYDSTVYSLKPQYQNKKIKKTSVLDIGQKDVFIMNTLQFLNSEKCVYSESHDALSALLDLQRSGNQSSFECKVQEHTNYGIEVRGALHDKTKFPELPFFRYTKAEKFEMARPKATQEYKKRQLERLRRIKDPEFIKKFSKAIDKHAMYDLLSIN